MHIGYTVVDSPLERLLLAATARGICKVSMGDKGSDQQLVQALTSEYPAATIQPDGAALREWINALLRYLEGQQPLPDLPLDLPGTPFQWQVWRALQAIPYGSTRTYQQLAEELGAHTGAARAVARACATNPVALVIPCHRVVRGDGNLGGYRWGLARKRRLLAREAGQMTLAYL